MAQIDYGNEINLVGLTVMRAADGFVAEAAIAAGLPILARRLRDLASVGDLQGISDVCQNVGSVEAAKRFGVNPGADIDEVDAAWRQAGRMDEAVRQASNALTNCGIAARAIFRAVEASSNQTSVPTARLDFLLLQARASIEARTDPVLVEA